MKITIIKSPFLFLSFVLFIATSAYSQEVSNPSIVKNLAIDSILIKKKAYNLEHPSMGFKIQLYYGSEDLAYAFKKKFEKSFPAQKASISFTTPDWKTMVGNYRTRIAADSAVIAIKKRFVGAVVVDAPISIE